MARRDYGPLSKALPALQVNPLSICRTCGYELALSHDNFYCLKSDLFKLLHPETLLNDTMVLRDYGGKDLARLLIGQSMYDALPGLV